MPNPVGRFAPTPSGPLHLGSLVAAVASYLSARAVGGRWLLRIDDLDTLRVVPGAEAMICRQLQDHGLQWDGEPHRQSDHQGMYLEALSRLRADGRLYACRCSRARLQAVSMPAEELDEPVYPGLCRNAGFDDDDGACLRLRLPDTRMTFHDRGLGPLSRQPGVQIGDFVVRRKDGQMSYQLACAVDEVALGITEVVRGRDLVASTFRQRWVLQALQHPIPHNRHHPLVVDADGRKLSKRDGDRELRADQAPAQLLAVLKGLGQQPPSASERGSPQAILHAAARLWRPEQIPTGPVRIP